MAAYQTIDTALAREMVRAKAIRGAFIVGQAGGWSVVLKHGSTKKALAAQRSRRVRVWRSLDRCVDYLKTELGIAQVDALDARKFARGAGATQRPDRSVALRRAHQASAYDAWLRAEIAASIEDPRRSVPHQTVERQFAKRRGQLRRRLTTDRDAS